MDADRMPAMQEAGRKFERDYGIKVNVDATENIPNSFPLAVQSNKGPDIVIFAHDKVGEWADGGLIAPIIQRKLKQPPHRRRSNIGRGIVRQLNVKLVEMTMTRLSKSGSRAKNTSSIALSVRFMPWLRRGPAAGAG
jgi:extracellular solute-binding protein